MFSVFTGSIARRLYSLLGVFALGFLCVVTFQLFNLRSNLDSFKRTELQSVVQSASSIAQNYYDRAKAGEFTEDQAKQMAMESLRGFRYQGQNYVFILSTDMHMLMHPMKPEMQGQDQTEKADPNGKLYIKEMVSNAKANGSAFEAYLYETPQGDPADKLSYAQVFAPWGWVIGSGVLLAAVGAVFMQAAIISGAITAAMMVFMLAVGVLITRSIGKPMARLTSVMSEVAKGKFDVVLPETDRRDEIGDMTRAVEVFRENGLKVSQLTEAEAARVIRDAKVQSDTLTGLQMAFGEVVEAAINGDFSKRVEANLGFDQLNAIAKGINNLVETVDRGLSETGSVLAALADTNLTLRVQGEFQGAFAKLKDDTNAVGDKFTEVVTQLRGTSRALKTATSEILAGANDLSERTTKQAATIEETSAAMEQLAATVTDNAKKAEDASSNAEGVTRTAEEGGQVMGKANLAMESITASSGKISNIIGMIDDIAFQTNLLALNASVEAARAGDAGKGFAVVAVEVRRLAQSSAQASSDIKVLIQQSASEVDNGSRLVADASGKLGAMLDAVRQNNALLGGIALASREQASSIKEVNTAVRQMDEMTQHNAALVEEINASIEQTESQAGELDRIVDVFNIEDARAARRPVAVQAASTAPRGGSIKSMQSRTKAAKTSYLSHGNAAIDKEWSEF